MDNLKFANDYIVFDLETTGLEPRTCQIIEIGALKYINNELVDEYHAYVNPEGEIPREITDLTGINLFTVRNARTIEEELPDFLKFIDNYTLVAHNAPFDISFLKENMQKMSIEHLNNNVIDTLELSKKYIPKAYNYKLTTLKKFFHLNYDSHRSLEDCKTTNYIYEYCRNIAENKEEDETLVKN